MKNIKQYDIVNFLSDVTYEYLIEYASKEIKLTVNSSFGHGIFNFEIENIEDKSLNLDKLIHLIETNHGVVLEKYSNDGVDIEYSSDSGRNWAFYTGTLKYFKKVNLQNILQN